MPARVNTYTLRVAGFPPKKNELSLKKKSFIFEKKKKVLESKILNVSLLLFLFFAPAANLAELKRRFDMTVNFKLLFRLFDLFLRHNTNLLADVRVKFLAFRIQIPVGEGRKFFLKKKIQKTAKKKS